MNAVQTVAMAIKVSVVYEDKNAVPPSSPPSSSAKTRTDKKNLLVQCIAAILYALASFTITVVNKNVLSVHAFPSAQCLGLGQTIATILMLFAAKRLHIIDYPDMRASTFRKLWPLPLIHMGNMITGLGSTKALSLPMFTALRRFLILLTMTLEYVLLNTNPTMGAHLSVYLMIVGALIAAYDDLAFNLHGYTCVMLNNIFSALNGVYIRQKLESREEMGPYGLIFYNSLFTLMPAAVIALITGDLQHAWAFEGWHDVRFVAQFTLSCVMGFLLTYSVFLCTKYNSALATSIIGCGKNICITYVGMFLGSDYLFSWLNFVGINISVAGSLIYLIYS